MSPDLDSSRNANGELHRGVIVVVTTIAVAVRRHPAILATRVVIPDRANGDVAAILNDFIMNVIRVASVSRSLFRNEMNHVVRARCELDRAVDVDDVHPLAGVDAPVPAP